MKDFLDTLAKSLFKELLKSSYLYEFSISARYSSGKCCFFKFSLKKIKLSYFAELLPMMLRDRVLGLIVLSLLVLIFLLDARF